MISSSAFLTQRTILIAGIPVLHTYELIFGIKFDSDWHYIGFVAITNN